MTQSVRLPDGACYAVIFVNQRTSDDGDGYGETAQRMLDLAARQPGFLGADSARGADGFGITVSYWDSEDAIAAWKANGEHEIARARGKADWYAHFSSHVAIVQRSQYFQK